VKIPGQITAIAIVLAYIGAGVLPCGGASAATIAAPGSVNAAAGRSARTGLRTLPPSAAAESRRTVESAGHAGHADSAGHSAHEAHRDSHSDRADASAGDEHASGHAAHAGHGGQHPGHAAPPETATADAGTPPQLAAPCACGCSEPSDAPRGNTSRIGFGLARASLDAAPAAAPVHAPANPRSLPQGPHAELDPVPI